MCCSLIFYDNTTLYKFHSTEISCPEDHLIYFRFIGRVMGKAMFDRQLVKGHMVKHLYKHILGWPVMFNDLKGELM